MLSLVLVVRLLDLRKLSLSSTMKKRITRKIMKNLICAANQESVSEFSAGIVQWYLQYAACANFAK